MTVTGNDARGGRACRPPLPRFKQTVWMAGCVHAKRAANEGYSQLMASVPVSLCLLSTPHYSVSMIITSETVELSTPRGPMRTYIYRPAAAGRYSGMVFFSEIFQQTEPIRRAASMYAGHVFVVAVPEIFHDLESPGTVLGYDQGGADRGNSDKITKELASYDDDAKAVFAHLAQRPDCKGVPFGSVGVCIGGHLAFRAAMNTEVGAAVCFYATDIHKGSLGLGQKDDSLARASDIKGELMMIWGRQDPHVPDEGRVAIRARLNECGANYTWHEFNAQHAFMRDDGHRYDPELALSCYGLAISMLRRRLG